MHLLDCNGVNCPYVYDKCFFLFLPQVQVVSSQVTQTAGNAYAVVKDFLQQAFTAVKPAVDVATPYVQQTADAAFKAVAPVANDLEQQAEKALQNAGVDTKPVLDTAKVCVFPSLSLLGLSMATQ